MHYQKDAAVKGHFFFISVCSAKAELFLRYAAAFLIIVQLTRKCVDETPKAQIHSFKTVTEYFGSAPTIDKEL